ncbi:hypothetical protein GKC56_07655 [Neisseriaceae bacterium PsAf]|nr:hypothetical protein [Neisseriaceae bacterium PsAf]
MKIVQSNLILVSILVALNNIGFASTHLLPDVAVSETENHIVINVPNVRLYVYPLRI